MRKAFCVISLILIAFFTLIGCDQNTSSSTTPGSLKIYLSSSAVTSLAADSSLTVDIRTGSTSGTIVKSFVLSKNSSSITTELNPGTYYLTLSNKTFTVSSTVYISAGGTYTVSINPETTGRVKFIISDTVKDIINKTHYNLTIDIRKTISSAPINSVWFGSGSSSQLVQLENGTYYLTYTFYTYNGDIELTIPETVTVKSGETTQVDIDCKPNGTVKVEMSSEASSVSPSNFVIYFYCDAERTDLANSLKYYSLNNTLSLDPGTYYISYTCDNGDPFDIDETVDVVNGGASTVKVDKKNDINYVFIDDYIRNNSSNLYPPDRDGFRIVFSDKDSDYTYSYNYKYSNNVYLKKGTYNISFENNPDDSGFLVSSDTTQISIGAERSNLILNLWVVGSINFAINDSSEASVALTLEKIVESNESEVKKIYSVDNNVQKVYLPVGEYKVTGSLVTDNPYIDFRLPSETIFLYQKKNVDYRPEVFRTGVLELSLTDDFYEKLDKLSVVVHLYRNGEYFKDLVISETTRENNRWYLPEGVYTYELEYDKHLMNLAFDADSFNVSYAKTTPIVCNKYGFARCIAVDIQNKIPGASKIEYYSYQDYPVLKIRLRNYPEGSVIKLYDMSNGTRCLGEGDYFEISLDQQGINKDNLQIRITKDNMLLDVQQIGNLWK